ncbi:chemotaxis protein methyltransferase WspC [Granulicella rosea]|uniref:Chemotaxis protein methyltransferase WspC n=1 Tax=Granulicella rosea TaxID=474952 RepID=A0A239KA29_9BACT|nr:CheR family methyltransferase [Granulicella rosea]SNT14820.1 chemotaxis protein methyltransferase WspC [Granulicella rosea]
MRPDSIFLTRIAERLAGVLGMEPRALEEKRLRSMVATRCRVLELADPAAYAEFFESSADEQAALIDAAVIRETRFFRDPAVFAQIQTAVVRLAALAGPGPLRVLSAPCSTGQETWSLAATLVEAGLPPGRFEIDACDISPAALAASDAAWYAEDALRHLTPEQRASLGAPDAGGWRVHETLRERVRFTRRNLAESGALAGEAYHLILCRNLFIYLAQPARETLARSLAAALAPGGRLVIGTADRVEELSALFTPLKPASSFAFVHRDLAIPIAPPRPLHSRPAAVAPVPAARPQAAPTAIEEALPATATGLYLRAVEAHQHGELRKAERRCRQALYLDGKHLPSLELLQSIWRQQPSLRLRRALDARIHRVKADALRTEETV